MEIIYKKPLQKNSYTILREAGYVPIVDRMTGKQSYVLRMSGARYPRFHIYLEEEQDELLQLHLHLDHKQHGWGERLHDTEYEGETIEEEAARVERWIDHYAIKDSEEEKSDEKKENFLDFIANLFG